MVVNHSDDMFAPVGLLRVVKCHTEPKTPPLSGDGISAADDTGKDNATSGAALSTAETAISKDDAPSAASAAAAAAAAATTGSTASSGGGGGGDGGATGKDAVPEPVSWPSPPPPSSVSCCLPHVHEGSGGLVYVSGVRAAARWPGAGGGAAAAVAARQAADCLAAARAGLEGVGVCLRDVCFVHLYLRDMALFSAVNEEYCR